MGGAGVTVAETASARLRSFSIQCVILVFRPVMWDGPQGSPFLPSFQARCYCAKYHVQSTRTGNTIHPFCSSRNFLRFNKSLIQRSIHRSPSALLPQAQSPDQQHQHYLGAFERYRVLGSTPDIPAQDLHLTRSPNDLPPQCVSGIALDALVLRV